MARPKASKGCERCRRGKKGCDLARPECSRCRAAGAHCDFSRSFRFIAYERQLPGTAPSNRSPIPGTQTSVSRPSIHAARTLAQTAFNIQSTAIFEHCYFPKDRGLPAGRTLCSDNQSAAFLEVAEGDVRAQRALAATATLFLYCRSGQESLHHRSHQLYFQAVHGITTGLQDSNWATSDAALFSLLMITLYEEFRPSKERYSTQNRTWFKFLAVTDRILEKRGTKKEETPKLSIAREEAQIMAIRSSFMLRKSHMPIRSMIFRSHASPPMLAIRNDVFKLIHEVPSLVHRHDLLALHCDGCKKRSPWCKGPGNGSQLLADSVELAERLRCWESQLLNELQTSSRVDESLYPRTILDVHELYGYDVRSWITMYATACLLLHSQIKLTNARMSLFHPEISIEVPSWIDPEPYARQLVHSTKYYLNETVGMRGLQRATFSIGITLCYYTALGNTSSTEFHALKKIIEQDSHFAKFRSFFQSAAADMVDPDVRGDAVCVEAASKMSRRWYRMTRACTQS